MSDVFSFPASFVQQRLWFLSQLEPDSPRVFGRRTLRLRGELDEAALRKSIEGLIERHEVLRTSFAMEGGQLRQIVRPEAELPYCSVDLRGVPASEREAAFRALAEEDRRGGFDLSQPPLMRALLVRMQDAEWFLILSSHHTVNDAWSQSLLERELGERYRSIREGRDPVLPELPIQYADYAVWQQEWLQGDEMRRQLEYWKNALSEAPPLLELPTDRPRVAAGSSRADFISFTVPAEMADALRELCRRENVTLFMGLLALFQTLLHRYSRQERVVVGTPIAGRTGVETEQVVGCFINTLALHTDLSGSPTFRETLHRCRETALGAFAHQDLPFEKIVEELNPQRQLSYTPIYQAMLVLQNASQGSLELPGVTVESVHLGRDVGADLVLTAYDQPGNLPCILDYSVQLFDAATAGRMGRHLLNLLAAAVENPDTSIEAISMLDDAERILVTETWTGEMRPYERDSVIPSLFEQRVRERPDAVALEWDGGRMSYRELNEHANRLAHYLRAMGVGPERPVGLCLERSPNLIAAVLAILKAGGAYVPLAPDYPVERLSQMIEDAGLTVLVSDEETSGNLPTFWGQLVTVDGDADAIASCPAENLPPDGLKPDSAAYLMYTSGSTGRPKGSTVDHRAVVRLVRGTNYAEFGPDEVILAFAPASFDASTLEIWGALLNGGRIALCPACAVQPEELAAFLRRRRVTTAWLTAALFHLMVEEQLEGLGGLRQLLAGGDVLSPQAVARFVARHPHCRLINGYGPTENTTFSCCYAVPRDFTGDRPVPIGRPIANSFAYVLEPSGEPAGIGVPGELFVGGDGLSRGYLNQPELTAERFVPNTVLPGRPDRLYRTGDLARWLPDGVLEFLGRMDGQIKIRGFRIEPGEIETALRRHPGVDEAIVMAVDGPGGERWLAAYVLPAEDGSAAPAELRTYLRRRLPDYMIPAVILLIDEIPLTPNGKLDRRRLPSPDGAREEDSLYTAPRDPVEACLAEQWQQLLGRERIGIHDNFFDLGGHSLLATQAVTRIREAFGLELGLQDLFAEPTIAGLAPRIGRRCPTHSSATPETPRADRTRPLPLSYAQRRIWLQEQLQPGTHVFNVPMAFRLTGSLNERALVQALRDVVRRHEVLRTSFTKGSDGEPAQVVHEEVDFDLDVRDLASAGASGEPAVSRALQEEYRRPFDLSEAPMLRATLLRLTPDAAILCLVLHHIAGDGWSINILRRELEALYRFHAGMGGERLSELPIQYADFAASQREELQGERWERLLDFWRRTLNGAPAAIDLPTDFPRGDQTSTDGAWHPFRLDAGLHREIRRACSESGATTFMLLLAAWYGVLRRMTGETDIVIGTDVANRNRRETEGLIGFFINQLPLRVAAPRRVSFRDLLQSVREVTLGAYDHQDAPFDLLVEQLQPPRLRGRSPFFQVKLILNNATAPGRLSLPGLTLSPAPVENEVAKYDLTLAARETDDGVACFIEYRRDLFAPSTPERLASQLQELLRHVLADDGTLIDEVPLHSAPDEAGLSAALTAEAGLSRGDYEALLAQLGGAGVG